MFSFYTHLVGDVKKFKLDMYLFVVTFPDNSCFILFTGLIEFNAALISSSPEILWYLNSFPNILIATEAWKE